MHNPLWDLWWLWPPLGMFFGFCWGWGWCDRRWESRRMEYGWSYGRGHKTPWPYIPPEPARSTSYPKPIDPSVREEDDR